MSAKAEGELEHQGLHQARQEGVQGGAGFWNKFICIAFTFIFKMLSFNHFI